MAYWFWNWIFFSFLGYLLEKGFARLTHAEKQNRKCFILLPLCPVYGFSVIAVLALPQQWRSGWLLLVSSALIPCLMEWGLHWYYERFFGVRYWDYRDQPLQWKGRVCLPFALAWTVLTPVAVLGVAPVISRCIPLIPPFVTVGCWMLLAADWLCSRYLLWRCGDTEMLSLGVLIHRGETA